MIDEYETLRFKMALFLAFQEHLSDWHEISKTNKFLPENLGFAWMWMEKVPKIFCQMMVNDGDDLQW